MNTMLKIQIQVIARQAAAALRSMVAQLKGVSAAANGSRFGNFASGMVKAGKDLQWVGRQLNFNFTLPLVYATTAAMKFALATEKAFTRLKKVYGDSAKDYTKELGQIRQAIRALSDIYGIAQSDVAGLAAQWAAAGATGAQLVRDVQTSIQLAILGDYEQLGDTFNDLIAIQSAYQMSSTELAKAIAILNTVENTTAANLPDLVTGIAKAGSMADLVGISFRELAAFVAVLTPATGSAANAGNALKTIFSRLIAPTKDTVDILKEMGIEFYGTEFQAKTVGERLNFLADKFGDLNEQQQAYVSSLVAGRWQVNKFAAIMKDLQSATSTYHDVLESIDPAKDADNLLAAQREISTLLQSDPKKVEILTTQIKNLMADAVIPLIPVMLGVLTTIRNLADAFNNLSPRTQKIIGGVLLLVVALGVLAQVMGSLQLLFGTFLKFIGFLGGAMVKVAALLVSPEVLVVAAIAAAVVAIYIFRDQIVDAMQSAVEWVVRAWGQLPTAIARIMTAIGNIIASAIKTIVEWLSYLNPFARHSPSLVDNVRAGVAVIAAEYASLKNIGAPFREAARDMATFAAATEQLRNSAKNKDRADQRKEIVTGAGPSAGPAADSLYADLDRLQPLLDDMNQVVLAQERRVKELGDAYDAAGKAVDAFDRSLDPLRDLVSSLSDQIGESQDRLAAFTHAPIAGMRAMEDEIFNNEMAQKRLRLEILKMEDAGKSYQEIQDQIAAINGDIESLRGKMTTLREAGAGSDILGAYQDQIDALEAQKVGLTAAAVNTEELQKQLEKLQRQGEIMDLEKSLKFDPLTRQIEQLADAAKELSFEDIIAGIKTEQANITTLTAEYDKQKASLDAQEAALKAMGLARDALKDQYDAEQENLAQLKEQYAEYEDQIKAIEQALKDAADAQKTLTDAIAAGGGAGGGGNLGDIGAGIEDPAQMVPPEMETSLQDMLDTLNAELANAFSIDPFAELRKYWDKFTTWWESTVQPYFDNLWGFLQENPGLALGLLILAGLGAALGGLPGLLIALLIDGLIVANWPAIQEFVSNNVALVVSLGVLTGLAFAFGGLPGLVIALIIDALVIANWTAIKDFFVDKWHWVIDNWPIVLAAAIIFAVAGIPGLILAALIAITWDPIVSFLSNAWHAVWDNIPFKDAIGNALGSVGTWIADIVGKAWGSISDFGSKIGAAFAKWGDLVAPAIEAFGHVKNVIVDAVKFWGGLLGDLGGMVKDAFGFWPKYISPIIKVVVGVVIGGLKLIWIQVSTILETIGSIFTRIWHGIQEVVLAVISIIHGTIKFFLDLINGDWSAAWNDIKEVVTGIWDIIVSVVTTTVGILYDIVTGLLTGVVDTVVFLWEQIKAIPEAILGALGDAATWLLQTGVDFIMGLIHGVESTAVDLTNWFLALPGEILGWIGSVGAWLWDTGSDFIQGLLDGIIQLAVDVADWFMSLPDDILGWIGSVAAWLWQKGSDFLTGLYNGVVAGGASVLTWFASVGQLIWDKIGDVADWLFDKGLDFIIGLMSGITTAAEFLFDYVVGIPGLIIDNLGDVLSTLVDAGGDLIQGFWNGAKAVWNTFAKWWNDHIGSLGFTVPDWVPLFGGKSVSVPNLPILAHAGGFVDPLKGMEQQYLLKAGEFIFTPAQTKALARLGIGGNNSSSTTMNNRNTVQASPSTMNNYRTLAFYGDLSFPNVTSGDDAEQFVSHLEAMAS